MIKIGLVQAAAHSISENLRTLERFVRDISLAGCEAICLPECFLTGYAPEQAPELAISLDNPVLSQVSALAQEWKVDILAGFMERSDHGFFITHGLFLQDGSRACYRKTHLGKKESSVFTPGDSLEVFSLSCGVKIGLQLCVETHFPEITQTLALKGAQVIFAPHASPRVSGNREAIWNKYIPARSYDNRVYMLCCNLWDESRFAGGCLATGPKGETVAADFADSENLLLVQIDRSQIAYYRTRNGNPSGHFFPAKRRPELYQIP